MTETNPLKLMTDAMLETMADVARVACRKAERTGYTLHRRALIRKLLRLFPKPDRKVWIRVVAQVADRTLDSLYHPHDRRPARAPVFVEPEHSSRM